jgi:hypothetical protein
MIDIVTMKERILRTAERLAMMGDVYRVDRYSYRDEMRRNAVKRLEKKGQLAFAGCEGRYLLFYRPEDRDLIFGGCGRKPAC